MAARPSANDPLYVLADAGFPIAWSEDGKTGEASDRIDTARVGAKLLEAMNARRPVVVEGKLVHVTYVGLRGGVYFRENEETVPAISVQLISVPAPAG